MFVATKSLFLAKIQTIACAYKTPDLNSIATIEDLSMFSK